MSFSICMCIKSKKVATRIRLKSNLIAHLYPCPIIYHIHNHHIIETQSSACVSTNTTAHITTISPTIALSFTHVGPLRDNYTCIHVRPSLETVFLSFKKTAIQFERIKLNYGTLWTKISMITDHLCTNFIKKK